MTQTKLVRMTLEQRDVLMILADAHIVDDPRELLTGLVAAYDSAPSPDKAVDAALNAYWRAAGAVSEGGIRAALVALTDREAEV